MKKFLTAVNNSIRSFSKDEEGAQIIEYALIIAVVSLALIAGFATLTANGGGFTAWISKVSTCLSTGSCTVAVVGP
jgi:pilus assembly protein Flp/PilA